jgi:hypothetical protein
MYPKDWFLKSTQRYNNTFWKNDDPDRFIKAILKVR